MGVSVLDLEGEIFSVRISLSLEGYIGGYLFIICITYNHIHPFIQLQLLFNPRAAFWNFGIFVYFRKSFPGCLGIV